MVGKLLYSAGQSVRSSFRISGDNIFVKDGHFQEAGLLENMAQTAALGSVGQPAAGDGPFHSCFMGVVKDFEVYNLPAIDDELITEVRVEDEILNAFIIVGKVWNKEQLVATGEMSLFTSKKQHLTW